MSRAVDEMPQMTATAADRPEPGLRRSSAGVPRLAVGLSIAAGVLMLTASAWSLLVPGLYTDGVWAREAFRGGDLVTLLLAAPLLLGSARLAAKGSTRAQVLWLGMLGYGVYNYAYSVFGSAFNDAFALHIAILSLSVFALATAIARVDVADIATAFRTTRAGRWVGAFLILTGVGQGGLWAFLVLRNAMTGEVLHDIPVAGQHLVFALDLALLVPVLILAGVQLVRRTPLGVVLGLAVSLFGFVYQVNLNLAAVFQARAGVAGVKAFPPEGLVLLAGLAIAAAALYRVPNRTGTFGPPAAEVPVPEEPFGRGGQSSRRRD